MPAPSRLTTLLACTLACGACQKDTADAHVKKGSAYLEQGQLAESVLEFRRAVQIDGQSGDAHLKLAEAHVKGNDAVSAIKEYIRAADLLPDNADVQLKAAQGLLLAGRFEDARALADKVLEKDKNNAKAQILRGNALAGLKDFNGAIAEYETAVATDPSMHEAFVNLGTVQFLRGNREESEAAFHSAIAAAPQSVDARLSLANFYWASQRPADAEKTLKEALAIDTKNATANRALAVFYMATGRGAEAEPYFKALDAAGTTESRATLAQYYVATDRRDEGRKILTDLLTRKDAVPLATVRLAALDAVEGQLAQSEKRLHEFLESNPRDLTAQLLYSDVLLRGGKRDQAEAAAKAAIAIDGNSAAAHLLAGEIYARSDRNEDAIGEFEKALSLDARPLRAALQLARIHLLLRHADQSLAYAQQALTIAPTSPEAQSLLVRNHLARGDQAKAAEIVATLQKQYPNTPGLYNLSALIQLSKKDLPGARVSYTRALTLMPSNLEALSGVVRLDLAGGHRDEALKRLDAAAATPSPDPDLLLTVARGYTAAGDGDKAEAVLKRAIETDPGRLQGYSMLGTLYAAQHRLNDAKDQFEGLLTRNPKSVPARTMLGMIHETQGHAAEAEKAYEQVLAIDPRAAVAANNLAWIYVASGRNLDDALRLAQAAAEQLRNEPAVNDTLGWVLVQKDFAGRAIPYLETAAKAIPSNAEFRYHLGTAYYKGGDWPKARRELEAGLKLEPASTLAPGAKSTLQIIGGSPATH
jgi:putative PEP-CTERM system TPR-repeat lipoprotein